MRFREQGFSLVEIAIVLIVVGVLAGVVVKGLAFVDEARFNQAKQSIQSMGSAYLTYLQRYLNAPGDDNSASSKFGPSSGDGDGNAQISAAESKNAWLHLRAAGLMTGSGTVAPNHPWGAPYQLIYSSVFSKNSLCLTALSGDKAQVLDASLDDGLPKSGSVQISESDTAYSQSKTYTLCHTL